MFFGQTNAPPTFQRYMNETFSRMVGERKVVIFMDDVIVHGKTRDELTACVSEFLQTCKEENLRLKISKSTFETQEVDFLGYKIRNGQYFPLFRKNGSHQGLACANKPQGTAFLHWIL